MITEVENILKKERKFHDAVEEDCCTNNHGKKLASKDRIDHGQVKPEHLAEEKRFQKVTKKINSGTKILSKYNVIATECDKNLKELKEERSFGM